MPTIAQISSACEGKGSLTLFTTILYFMDHAAGNEVPWSFWWPGRCPWGILAPIIAQIRSQSYSLISSIFFITIPHILRSNPLWYPKLAKGSRGNWRRSIDLFDSVRVLEIMHLFEVCAPSYNPPIWLFCKLSLHHWFGMDINAWLRPSSSHEVISGMFNQ